MKVNQSDVDKIIKLFTIKKKHPQAEKWQNIIQRRYEGETLQSIASSYNVSRERIRQIILFLLKNVK